MVWSAIPANAERKARPPCSRQPCQPSLHFLPREKMFGNGTLLIINLPLHSDSPGRAEAGQGFSKSKKWMADFQHLWAWLEHISNDRQTLRCQKRSFTVLCLSFPSYLCHAHCRFFCPLKDGRAADLQDKPHLWSGAEAAQPAEGSVADPETDSRQSEEGARGSEESAGVQQESGQAGGLD